MPKNKLINLLPQEEFDASILGRMLKWAMGSFRIIVILTEMVVMGAFLSRFWLDAQNSDLSDEISIKSAQVMAQQLFEKDFKDVQKRLSIIKTIDGYPKPSERLSLISQKMPMDIILSNFSISEKSADFKGVTASEISIAQFMSNLRAEKSFKTVDLNSLSTSTTDEIQTVFQISTNF